MKFAIDNFHYFDTKLLNEQKEAPIDVDWKKILKERQLAFPEHFFIVLEKDKALFIDTILFSFINIQSHKKTVEIKLNSSLRESAIQLYILQMHHDEQHLKIETIGDDLITVFHENIICQKGHSLLELSHWSPLNYYHTNTNLTHHLSHQEISVNSFDINNLYFSQNQESSKNKIDVQINLYKNAKTNYHMLAYLEKGQLRDDSVEVIHHESDTISSISYFSLNSGKSVSQVNSIVTPNAFNSETKQVIKHILLTEDGQSYSKPNLMISNPLVVGSHGNSIGSFNLDNLFYLCQKGLTESEAKKLISHSYINQFCDNSSYSEQLLHYFLETKNA